MSRTCFFDYSSWYAPKSRSRHVPDSIETCLRELLGEYVSQAPSKAAVADRPAPVERKRTADAGMTASNSNFRPKPERSREVGLR